jgi:hypothetical protein
MPAPWMVVAQWTRRVHAAEAHAYFERAPVPIHGDSVGVVHGAIQRDRHHAAADTFGIFDDDVYLPFSGSNPRLEGLPRGRNARVDTELPLLPA